MVTPSRRRKKQWALSKVCRACRSAPAVWLVLADLAAERRSHLVTPTRELLSRVSGVRGLKTVSKALTTLHNAGWIERIHKPVTQSGKRTATLLRIVLRRGTYTQFRKGQTTTRTETPAVEGKERPKGKGQKTPQDLPKGKGGVPSPPLTRGGEAVGTADIGDSERPDELTRPIADLVKETFGHGR